MLIASLERIDDTQDLSRVATSRGGVRKDGADGLLGVDDEHTADGESNALGVDIRSVLVIDPTSSSAKNLDSLSRSLHVIGQSHFALLVTNDGKGEVATRNLVDILDPASMGLDGIGRETNQLDTTLLELRLQLCESTELGRAHGGVVFGMGEQNDPAITNKLVEVDWTSGGFGLEVGCSGAQAETMKAWLAKWTSTRTQIMFGLRESPGSFDLSCAARGCDGGVKNQGAARVDLPGGFFGHFDGR